MQHQNFHKKAHLALFLCKKSILKLKKHLKLQKSYQTVGYLHCLLRYNDIAKLASA